MIFDALGIFVVSLACLYCSLFAGPWPKPEPEKLVYYTSSCVLAALTLSGVLL